MRRIVVAGLIATGACGQQPVEKIEAEDRAAQVTIPATSTSWDRNLIALMPFIDACIAKSPTSRTVTYAAATGEALVTVRLSGESGAFDCTVPDDDPTPTYAAIRPRGEDWAPAGENEAIFVRGPGENPGGECYEAPEVRDANGALLGWMLDPAGC